MNDSAPAAARTASGAEQVFYSLLRTAHALEERLETALAEVGLSGAKFGALKLLAGSREAMPLSELAAKSACVRSNITQLVDRLEADGLVRRVADPGDRRSVRAEITPLGRERCAAGAERVSVVHGEFRAALGDVDQGALQQALAALKKK